MVWQIEAGWLLLSEGLIVLAALSLLILSRFSLKEKHYNTITIASLLAAIIPLALFTVRSVIDSWLVVPTDVYFYDNHLRIDYFSQVTKAAFVGTALLVAYTSRYYMASSSNIVEFHFLLLTATLGMLFVASSQDLLTMFVGLELTSLSSYALVAHRKQNDLASEAGAKYFVIGAFSSAIAVYGISLIYGVTNTLNFYEIRTELFNLTDSWNNTLFIASLFLITGFGFKVAIVPFHSWAPDVYEGAPTTVTAFLAGASKLVGFIVLFKVFVIGLIGIQDQWRIMVAIIAVSTMTAGNLFAISQTSFRRMLAYSSIAQAGYILIALPVVYNYNGDGQEASLLVLSAALAHLIIHVFMKGGAFLVCSSLSIRGFSDDIRDLKGLALRAPAVGFSLAIFMLSLAGIPPLAGFWSKFWLFGAAIKAGLGSAPDWLIALAIAGVLNSALSLYYYLKVVRYIFVNDEFDAVPSVETDVSKFSYDKVPIFISCIFILLLIPIFFGELLSLCEFAVRSLLNI